MYKKYLFGKTWWGNKWIQVIHTLSYNQEQVIEGRNLAKKRNVKEIIFKGTTITAKVTEFSGRPHRTRINFKKFKRREIETIKDIIGAHPSIAAELSSGKLPGKFFKLLSQQNVQLIPEGWKELDNLCSCSNHTDPCPHLAATFYALGNEIDKDPFLLFNLKGLPTKNLIAFAGMVKAPTKIETFQDKFIPYQDNECTKNFTIQDSIDLTLPEFNIRQLFKLLDDSPIFYNDGNFKNILLKIYDKAINSAKEFEIKDRADNLKDTNFSMYITRGKTGVKILKGFITPAHTHGPAGTYETMKVPIWNIDTGQLAFQTIKGKTVYLNELINFFLSIPLTQTTDKITTSGRFLSFTASVALSLVKSGLFVPEIYQEEDTIFKVRYVPFVYNQKIEDLLHQQVNLMPPGFAFDPVEKTFLKNEGAYDILCFFISHIVRQAIPKTKSHEILRSFVSEYPVGYTLHNPQNTAKNISNWLDKIYLRHYSISPVIHFEFNNNDRFSVSIDVRSKKKSTEKDLSFEKIFDADTKTIFETPAEEVRTDVIKQLTIASTYIPGLKNIINTRGKKHLELSQNEMADILYNTTDILNTFGIQFALPEDLKRTIRPGLALRASVKEQVNSITPLNLPELLKFSYEIMLDDELIDIEDFKKLLNKGKKLIKYKGSYMLLMPDDISTLLEKLKKPVPGFKSSMDFIHAAMTDSFPEATFFPEDKLAAYLQELKQPAEVDLPENLSADLRPYQLTGYKWLYSNTIKGFGSCIADDMGLGKTLQVIALIARLKQDGLLKAPALVICPTTLPGNWYKECQKFANDLRVHIYHGPNRRLYLKKKDLVITTYGILRQELEKFKGIEWGPVIIDEAQNIKNPETAQSRASRHLNSLARIVMTGTPVENNLTDFWSLFDFINPGYLGNIKDFQKFYAMPIEKYRDTQKIHKLKKAIAPFFIRRLKSDKTIISDLPDKIIIDDYCYLSNDQVILYTKMVNDTFKLIKESTGIERKGLIFKLITALKQICNHPANYLKEEKALTQNSGKAEKLVSLIEKIMLNDEKVLVFTQYKEMGSILEKILLTRLNEQSLFFHGSLSRKQRELMIDQFQNKPEQKVMIVSLKAGGTGLNLTSATNVVHYDLWWNPAVEDQATDRTYRIGQQQNVHVHRLITLGTFEEKIDEIIKNKKELSEIMTSTGEKWISEFSDDELKGLLEFNQYKTKA
jgi:SNF2 family DNA or RNA helicase/uncharacterized Zn finger protein